jgi:hypothetical protein
MQINKTIRTRLAMAVLITTIVLSVGCTPQQETAVTNAVSAALQNLKDARELMEAFGRDIKRTYGPDEEAYRSSESRYAAARSAYQGYIAALKIAVLSDAGAATLANPAQDATAACSEFMATATQLLDPTVNTRKVSFGRAISLPTNIPAGLHGVPMRSREAMVRVLEDQISWAAWATL